MWQLAIGDGSGVGAMTLGPRARERPRDAGWVELGTLQAPGGGSTPAPAQPPGSAYLDWSGLVTPAGARWSLDWWIGGDDRWYLPARETTVRQRRLGAGPVVETLVRIPSGDARHRAYGAMVGPQAVTVVEVHNDSPVPVALALALRPYAVGPPGSDRPAPPFPAGLRLHRTVLTHGDQRLLVLPRPPAHAGASARRDLLSAVEAGETLTWDDHPGAAAVNAVVLFPLPHRTSLRFLVPALGGARPASELDPRQAPEAEAVARGWNQVVEAGARLQLPDPGLGERLDGARARLLLAAPSLGSQLAQLRPGAGTMLAALAAGGHRREVAAGLRELATCFPGRLPEGGRAGAEIVAALDPAVRLAGAGPWPEVSLRSRLVETAARLTALVERAGQGSAALVAKDGLARLARPLDRQGAHQLEAEVAAAAHRSPPTTPPDLAAVNELAALASPAGAWGGATGDDPVAAARFVLALRALVVDDSGPGLILLPGFVSAWRGGTVEIHHLPTVWGRLSFALRWHGYRPALLWQLDPDVGPEAGAVGPVELRAPALDLSWSATAPRGEALLTGWAQALPTRPGPGQDFS